MDHGIAQHSTNNRGSRHSIRLPDYDYSQIGLYYVTVCCAQRSALFGSLAGPSIKLNQLGEIVTSEWQCTSELRPDVSLDEFIVMPDHIHGIISIDRRRGVLHTPRLRRLTPPSHTVGAIVRGFKAATTRQINAHRHTPGAGVWQRNYYEHVIRDEVDLAEKRNYIATNPTRSWLRLRAIAASVEGVCNTPLRD